MKQYLQSHKKLVILLAAVPFVAVALLVLTCNLWVKSYQKYTLPATTTKHARVGLVLGAGITKQGKPFRELEARLDVAAEALNKGTVDKLILSGDNRFKGYDEPTAMVNYLVNKKHIARAKLQPDFAGRSTFESCERAHTVFGVSQTIIFSAGTHLPRAVFLCRHFGIEAYGILSGVEANNAHRREVLARVKAIISITVHGEKTVLGPPIKV